MFGELVVLYLFLGGTGAGALLVASVADLLLVQRRVLPRFSRPSAPGAPSLRRMLDIGFLLGFFLLALGVVALFFDLGRMDRALELFLSPRPTLVTFGVFSLSALLLFSGCVLAARFLYMPRVSRFFVVGAEIGAVCAAIATILYTGFLLMTIGGVAFWETGLIPLLFAVSSLSAGTALILISSAFVGESSERSRAVRVLSGIDAVALAIELALVCVFVLRCHFSQDPSVRASYGALFEGGLGSAWWLGFLVCGLGVPLVGELVAFFRAESRVPSAVFAALVLVGAFCLRFVIVNAGAHRDLSLDPPCFEEVFADEGEGVAAGERARLTAGCAICRDDASAEDDDVIT